MANYCVLVYICVCLQLINGQFISTPSSTKTCTAVNEGAGVCVSLSACQPYLELMRDVVSNPVTTWILRQAHCGFDGDTPMVCCPIEDQKTETDNLIEEVTESTSRRKATKVTFPTSSPTTSPIPSTLPSTSTTSSELTTILKTTVSSPITTTLPTISSTLPPISTVLPAVSTESPLIVKSTRKPRPVAIEYDLLSLVGETCNTVYNTTGSCKDIYLCEPFLALVNQSRTNPAAVEVLQKASCGFKGNIPQVCCPLPNQAAALKTSRSQALPSADARTGQDFLTALPEPPHCGLSNVSLDRVAGGIPAKLGAFPWMALLGYRDESVASNVSWKCGGVLVSVRHVLTAAHCIHLREDELYLVRLGELDLAREDEGATPVDYRIKTMLKHERYTRNNPVLNDIGVLVLEEDVHFTELIKPICLFTSKSSRSETFEDYNPFVAGWGDIKWQGVRATHLQVAQVPVLSDATCEEVYRNNLRSVSPPQFSEQAMCAGYMKGKIDSCSGDSGGPLMLPIAVEGLTPRTYFYAIGIVSFGRKCAQERAPGVYARIGHYMPWIEEKILGRAS